MKRHLSYIIIAAIGLGLCVRAGAQSYPTRTVRIIAPTSVGSGPDLLARVLGQKLAERWGQQVVVENKVGASSILGTAEVAKSPGDGYNLVVVPDAYSSNPALLKPFPFDPIKDIAPVAQLAIGGMVLVVHPSLPVKTVAEFVAYAKSQPGKMNYGSAGVGSTHHMMMEMFKSAAGIDLAHIPYSKGPGPMYLDLIEGRLSAAFAASNAARTHVPTARMRPLGVAGDKRLRWAPEIPTVAESGYRAFNIEGWYGLMAAGTTPPELQQRIYTDVAAVLALPEVRERLLKLGMEPAPLPPGPFAEKVRADMARRAKLVQDVGIKAN